MKRRHFLIAKASLIFLVYENWGVSISLVLAITIYDYVPALAITIYDYVPAGESNSHQTCLEAQVVTKKGSKWLHCFPQVDEFHTLTYCTRGSHVLCCIRGHRNVEGMVKSRTEGTLHLR